MTCKPTVVLGFTTFFPLYSPCICLWMSFSLTSCRVCGFFVLWCACLCVRVCVVFYVCFLCVSFLLSTSLLSLLRTRVSVFLYLRLSPLSSILFLWTTFLFPYMPLFSVTRIFFAHSKPSVPCPSIFVSMSFLSLSFRSSCSISRVL